MRDNAGKILWQNTSGSMPKAQQTIWYSALAGKLTQPATESIFIPCTIYNYKH